MIQKKQKETAIDAYIGKAGNIQAMLERLTEAAGDHFGDDPDNINWSHVGSVDHIEEKLKYLCDVVFKEGEHAPENKA